MYSNTELLDLVERYKAEKGIPIGNEVKLWFALFARWLLSQNLQKCGLLPPVDNKIMFADYIQRCVIDRGQMTYPSLQDAIKAWDETMERFGDNDRQQLPPVRCTICGSILDDNECKRCNEEAEVNRENW